MKNCCIGRHSVADLTLPAIAPKRQDLGGRTCSRPWVGFADDPEACPAAAVLAFEARSVRGAEAVAVVSEQGQPCFGSDSAEGTGHWSREGRADLAGNFATGRLRFLVNCGCVGRGPVGFLGLSTA
jgi:hypothetical protein